MKGEPRAIAILNDVLTNELSAINQYFLHSRMCRNWGFDRLAEIMYKESIDEMKHADQLIERILYLDGIPNVQKLNKLNIGETVEEQLKSDFAMEEYALKLLRDGIEELYTLRDHTSRVLLERILESEEEHVDWIEAQFDQIKQMGIENYLAQQVKPGG